ncbi:RRP15 family protein [Sporobolomyces salmoneus]|uniref:RRP15 family protein n=1 Tax=Sporobolomyces salmoneus TaxID=183962 RepID=UPI00317C1B2A
MSNQPKSILKKRARSPAVAPTAEEAPVKKGQIPSQEPINVPSSEDESELEAEEEDFSAGSDDEELEEEEDDDEAIRDMLEEGQERPAKKLKHTTLRPTTADAFSNSLQHLLSLPSTSANPVPLRAPPSAATLRLERRTRGVIRETKAQHLSRGHVRDVIGGWGARPPLPFSQWESKSARDFEAARRGGSLEEGETGAEREKRLRKLAQRGVVRLFNAIGAAQGVTGKDKEQEEQEARKKAAVKLNAGEITSGGTVNRRPNVLGGRGKGEALTNLSKASFLDLIRAGTAAPAVK